MTVSLDQKTGLDNLLTTQVQALADTEEGANWAMASAGGMRCQRPPMSMRMRRRRARRAWQSVAASHPCAYGGGIGRSVERTQQ